MAEKLEESLKTIDLTNFMDDKQQKKKEMKDKLPYNSCVIDG